jgi:fucose 4-O-acetylase-like acetyltransferase
MNCEKNKAERAKATLILRDDRIDSVKYWLIVLVITGHVFQCFKGIPTCKLMWDWIYLFHMPLFIFISGYFSQKKSKKVLKTIIWKLVEPLIIYQIIGLFFIVHSFTVIDIITPCWVLWYLLSLIYWRLMLQIIPEKVLNKPKFILSIALCISVLAGFLPFNDILAIQKTLSFLPFFFLGYYMRGKNLFLPEKYKLLCLLFLILSFAIPLFYSQYLGSLTHDISYVCYNDAIRRLLVFCLSIPVSLAFINVCINRPWIARQGQLTMQYYIYHAVVLYPFLEIMSKFGLPSSLLTAILYTIVITIGIGILSYLPYFNKFTNPSLFLK